MFTNSLLGTTADSIYTSTGTTVMVVGYFCNIGNDPVTLTIWLLQNGDTVPPEDRSIIYYNVNITPGDTFIIDTEKLIFENGDQLYAEASVADVVAVTINTYEI